MQAYGLPAPRDIYSYQSLCSYFKSNLDLVAPLITENNRLVIILDGIDHLFCSNHAHSLIWLPRDVPPYVTIILTTDSDNEQTMRNISSYIYRIAHNNKLKYEDLTDNCILKVEPLDEEEQTQMVNHLLKRKSRQLTQAQYEVTNASCILSQLT